MSTELKPIDDNTTAKIITKLAKDIRLILPDKVRFQFIDQSVVLENWAEMISMFDKSILSFQ